MARTIASVFLILAVAGSVVWAEDYDLGWCVFGGGSQGATDDFIVRTTVGQSVIGVSHSDLVEAVFGYWCWPGMLVNVDELEVAVPHFTYGLRQNYPNPFNPRTTIEYSVGDGSPVSTVIRLYDVRGAVVRTLVSDVKQPGHYRVVWDGRGDDGGEVSSGVYFCRLTAGDFERTLKLVILK